MGEFRAKTPQMDRGSPWESGYIESFNGKLRDEVLERDVFYIIAGSQGANGGVKANLYSRQGRTVR